MWTLTVSTASPLGPLRCSGVGLSARFGGALAGVHGRRDLVGVAPAAAQEHDGVYSQPPAEPAEAAPALKPAQRETPGGLKGGKPRVVLACVTLPIYAARPPPPSRPAPTAFGVTHP
jgi:hypothetical protein